MKRIILAGSAIGFIALLGTTTALADVTVAFVGPITGQVAALGEQGRQGAQKAVDDINKAGGINGEKLVLEIGDDACDPKQAVNVANQMASKEVKFVAGHLCSAIYSEIDPLSVIRGRQKSPIFAGILVWGC